MSTTYNGRFPSPPEPPSGGRWIVGGLLMIPLWSIPFAGAAVLAGSICCFVKGGKMNEERKMHRRFHEMSAVIGMRTRVPVRDLAKLAEMGRGEMRKYLQKMIVRGYFGSDAMLDLQRDELVVPLDGRVEQGNNWRDVASEMMGVFRSKVENAHVPDVNTWKDLAGELKHAIRNEVEERISRKPQPPKPKAKPQPEPRQEPPKAPVQPEQKKTYMDELEQTLNELYQLNEQIEDEAVSRRIDRIGTLTASIFRVVIEKPERAQDVRKFMNYYLPTTLKLLKSYDMLEEQSYQGENIVASRKKIENVLDMLIAAYEKLLDRLFSNDALDIATDIDVLQTMIAGDGLSDKGQIRLTL